MVPAGVESDWFALHIKDALSLKHAETIDSAFLFQRQESTNKVGWTLFHQSLSSGKSLGCLPIIIAPAHEPDTLNTAVQWCIARSSYVGPEHTVITVDQALYYKLMEVSGLLTNHHRPCT